MTMLELKDIKKRYANTEVIHGVNLSIEKGQFVVIVGPSGCGKSTMLRMIAGLEDISSGNITIHGKLVNRLPPKSRNIAMVFQNYALYPHMNVYDNMAYGLKMRKMKKADIKVRITKAAEVLKLTDLLKRRPKDLSGGQRQRVAMGRAMVREPELFLFDEPLSNLDARLRVDMRLEIYKLQRELGITSIYVTHDQVEAMTLADVLVVMNHGHVEQMGTPLEIYNKPATQFVASFIGSPEMNFLDVKVCGDGRTIKLNDQITLPFAGSFLDQYERRQIVLGIRPEALHIAEKNDAIQFAMRVDLVEALGSDTIAYGRMVHGDARLVVKLSGHIRTHVGEVLTLSLRPSNLHFFDKTSGKRIIGL